MMRPPVSQRGYSLIEVIMAFGILALGMVLLLGTLSGATRQVRRADEAGRAALHAQSLLDQLGVSAPLQPGRRDGELEEGRYRWVLDVRPYRDPTARADQPIDPGAGRLLEVALTVQWGEGRGERIGVRSVRMAPPSLLGEVP